MRISRADANDFFDHHCYFDLQNGELCPSERLTKIRHLDAGLTPEDYSQMKENPQRYLHPPYINPMYMDYIAARRSGVSDEALIALGYRTADVEQKYLSGDTWKRLYEDDEAYVAMVSDARHALRSYMQKIGKNGIFIQNVEALRHEMIEGWFLERGVRVEQAESKNKN